MGAYAVVVQHLAEPRRTELGDSGFASCDSCVVFRSADLRIGSGLGPEIDEMVAPLLPLMLVELGLEINEALSTFLTETQLAGQRSELFGKYRIGGVAVWKSEILVGPRLRSALILRCGVLRSLGSILRAKIGSLGFRGLSRAKVSPFRSRRGGR